MRAVLHSLLPGLSTVALLAGCSGGGAQASPTAGSTSPLDRSSVSQQLSTNQSDFINVADVNAPNGNEVIVSDSQKNTVSVFSAAGKLNALISSGLSQPSGLATDAAQNLYVANGQNFNVLVYAKPYSKVRTTLADPGLYPRDVAVSNAGVVAVTNPVANPYGPGAVRFYPAGSPSACATVTDAGWQGMTFGAFDASGTLFMDGYDRNGNPLVGEILGGCKASRVTTLSIANTLSNPQGVQIVNGNVLILDQVYASFAPVIYTYAKPSGHSLGSPTATTNLSAGIEMTTFAMTSGNRDLWIAHSDAAAGRIKYTYPAGRFVESFNEKSLATAFGIAVNPAAKP